MGRYCSIFIGALAVGLFAGSSVFAEPFSYKCGQPEAGANYRYTFDDLRKRVIAYNFLGGHMVGFIYKGPIKTISAAEILFDLSIFDHPETVFGSYTLNRKENWLTSSRWRDSEKQPCEPTSVRSVMDFWPVFEGNL
jgi:hypothetical protein